MEEIKLSSSRYAYGYVWKHQDDSQHVNVGLPMWKRSRKGNGHKELLFFSSFFSKRKFEFCCLANCVYGCLWKYQGNSHK